ncbi:MAG: hypothetical protein AB8B74_15490, partial [Crocinitomicaceae bacterium]
MKTIFTFAFALFTLVSFSQIDGTWKLAPMAQALGVGPSQGNITWWSNSAGDVTTRACLFDDSIKFDAGVMTQYMDGSSWIEVWQGAAAEGCDVPVAPHDGNPSTAFTYAYDATAGTLTVNGTGAHVGLPKATNQGELSASPPPAVPTSIVYDVVFSNNSDTMTVDCNFGGGYWRFVYIKTSVATPPPPVPVDITFSVDMSQYNGASSLADGVFLNGTFNNWCGSCNPMTDMGNGLYEVTISLLPGQIEYKFTVNDWMTQEALTDGDPCTLTTGTNINRVYNITTDATIPTVCWESCSGCPLGLEDINETFLQITPNPVSNSFVLNFEGSVQNISILDLSGRMVRNIANYAPGTQIDA